MSSDASSTAHLSAACALPSGHQFNPNKAEFPPAPLSLEKTCLSKEEMEGACGYRREGHIADVYTLHEGKVVQMQAYADPAEARKAIGYANH